MTTLVLLLKKIESIDKAKCNTFYSHLKAETFINENDIDDVFELTYTTILWNIEKTFKKRFRLNCWFSKSIIVIFQRESLSWWQLHEITKKKDDLRKGLISLQNTNGNECFNWCLVRYLHPADCNSARITNA